MSFVDLATIAVHRHHEMEARIKEFQKKCDLALQNVINLQTKAQSFVEQLNCDPSELKDRFLSCMKQLDEYTYLITDFNLAMCKLDESINMDYTPVQDTKNKAILPPPTNGMLNLMDALSEPTPSTSKTCQNQCPSEVPRRKKVPKEEQLLIAFSSTSCSSESVPLMQADTVEREIQYQMPNGERNLTDEDLRRSRSKSPDGCNLPAQSVMPVDFAYSATIMHVDGPSFWVITDDFNDVYTLMTEMTEYYKRNHTELSLDQVMSLTYCACFDKPSDCFYRGLFIRLNEMDTSVAELFLVDTGEVRVTAVTSIEPLAPEFCVKPPYARCCHLAGVDLISYQDEEVMEKQEAFMTAYMGTVCSIEVDDNTSESLGVYVTLPSGERLNDMIVKEGLAVAVDKNQSDKSVPSTHGPPEISDTDFDITQGLEFDDPVEAVTGYHNRDEADICKHYKGGPEKTCFKGSRCTKKHVLKHPDGWTMDQVRVVGKCLALPLPAPATWLRVHVTHVAHFDRFYAQLVADKPRKETVPKFGIVLPPTTLESLVRDMNSPATVLSYKQLTTVPAPGEMVAALYPLDGQWYRARVVCVTRTDQNVEVQYIDYGNTVFVKENEVRVLPARHAVLPAQAVRCALAGISARTHCSRQWATARTVLDSLVHERTLEVQVIARDYDEITVEVIDETGYNIAEELVRLCPQLELKEYAIIHDTNVTSKLVVP